MKPEIEQILSRYESGPGDLAEAVRGLSVEQLRARPIAGQWSPIELVCHLSDTEQFFADRMKRTIALDRPLLMGADTERYPSALGYQDRDVTEEVDFVRLTRGQMARILRLQPDDAWSRPAVHSEAGLVDLRTLLDKAVAHFVHHLEILGKKRAALGVG